MALNKAAAHLVIERQWPSDVSAAFAQANAPAASRRWEGVTSIQAKADQMDESSLETDQAELDKRRQRHQAIMTKLQRRAEAIRESASQTGEPGQHDPGDLTLLAALTDLDHNGLLGLLLDGARGAAIRHAILRQWKGKGKRFIQRGRGGLSDCRCQAGGQDQNNNDPGMVES